MRRRQKKRRKPPRGIPLPREEKEARRKAEKKPREGGTTSSMEIPVKDKKKKVTKESDQNINGGIRVPAIRINEGWKIR